MLEKGVEVMLVMMCVLTVSGKPCGPTDWLIVGAVTGDVTVSLMNGPTSSSDDSCSVDCDPSGSGSGSGSLAQTMETLLARAAAQDLAILLDRAAAQVLATLLARAATLVVEGGALVFAATMNATQVVSHLFSWGSTDPRFVHCSSSIF